MPGYLTAAGPPSRVCVRAAGILDCAHICVALLKLMFPTALDDLPRERAFFPGPAPLLLRSFNEDDLAILVSGSDKAASQVEFGAHQVVLVRNKESKDNLPKALLVSSAIIMTVAQAKGLGAGLLSAAG